MVISKKVERKDAEVLVGATVELTMSDARALYELTTLESNVDYENQDAIMRRREVNNEMTRQFVRKLAKGILLNSGTITPYNELMDF